MMHVSRPLSAEPSFSDYVLVEYRDETPGVVKFYADAEFERTALPGAVINFEPGVSEDRIPQWPLYPIHQQGSGLQEAVVGSPSCQPEPTSHHTSPQSLSFAVPLPTLTGPSTSPRSMTSPASKLNRAPHESPASLNSSGSTLNPIQAIGALSFPLADREAELLRNFSENLALWADITDIERHFEIDVPRRALSNPVLRNAIFTFSSRHMNRRPNGDWTEALEYHNRCLELLIPGLSGHQEGYNEEILAAVAILRLNEEMDCEVILALFVIVC